MSEFNLNSSINCIRHSTKSLNKGIGLGKLNKDKGKE